MVLKAGTPTVPRIERAEKAEPRDQILEWIDRCRGNLVRVHDELVAQGVALSYPALTAFCRRHGIGHAPPVPVATTTSTTRGAGDAARHVAASHDDRGRRAADRDRVTRAVLLAHAFFPGLPGLHALLLQSLPDRRAGVLGGGRDVHDR